MSQLKMSKNAGPQISAEGTADAEEMSGEMMGNIRQTSEMQMRQQTEMGLLQMMVKLNEALAKLFKALGDAIKGLAG